MVGLFALVAASQCVPLSERAAVKQQPREETVGWLLTIETEGGIAGRGTGGITLDSKGDATVSDMVRQCTVEVPVETLAEVDRNVRAAKPSAWKPEYSSPGADRFLYRLTLTTILGEESTTWQTTWVEGDVEIPSDLVALSEEAWRVRTDLLTTCGPGEPR